MNLQNAKGTKDFLPEEKMLRQDVIDLLRSIFESYGFAPLETPILERMDILAAKYAGGGEILKETFKLKDQGGRELGLRYDLTVPLARFVGMTPNLKMPFKRYEIGRVFRDGPIKKGRLREFWQCDVDIVGSKSMLADAECIQIALDFFERIGFPVTIEVNNRKILDGILESLQIPEKQWEDIIISIDKLKKIPLEEVKKELKEKGLDEKRIKELLDIFQLSGSNKQKVKQLKKIIKSNIGLEGLKEMEALLENVDQKNVVFSISLARGLAYYTGTVFEVFTKNFSSALAAGGRYDRMIGEFLGGNKEYPAVGISFGIEPITELLTEKRKASRKTPTQVYIIPINTLQESKKIADELRKQGLNVEMDVMQRGPSKNLEYANSLGIPYVVIVGEEEVKQNKVKLKDMRTGKEKLIAVNKARQEIAGK